MIMTTPSTPSCLVAISSHCPHCKSLINQLCKLSKDALISPLEIINIEAQPQFAEQYNIKTVPWFKLDGMIFHGLYTETELKHWANIANTENGYKEYITTKIDTGNLDLVANFITTHQSSTEFLPKLLSDLELSLQHKLGLGAVLETISTTDFYKKLIPPFQKLLQHDDQRIRCDIIYYLGLSEKIEVKELLVPYLDDPHADVRDIALETIEELEGLI